MPHEHGDKYHPHVVPPPARARVPVTVAAQKPGLLFPFGLAAQAASVVAGAGAAADATSAAIVGWGGELLRETGAAAVRLRHNGALPGPGSALVAVRPRASCAGWLAGLSSVSPEHPGMAEVMLYGAPTPDGAALLPLDGGALRELLGGGGGVGFALVCELAPFDAGAGAGGPWLRDRISRLCLAASVWCRRRQRVVPAPAETRRLLLDAGVRVHDGAPAAAAAAAVGRASSWSGPAAEHPLEDGPGKHLDSML